LRDEDVDQLLVATQAGQDSDRFELGQQRERDLTPVRVIFVTCANDFNVSLKRSVQKNLNI
jgi:hypothetical protein